MQNVVMFGIPAIPSAIFSKIWEKKRIGFNKNMAIVGWNFQKKKINMPKNNKILKIGVTKIDEKKKAKEIWWNECSKMGKITACTLQVR